MENPKKGTKAPVRKSNKVKKTSKTVIPEEQKCLKVSVNKINGVNHCRFEFTKDDVLVLAKSTGCKVYDASTALITNGMESITGGIGDPNAIADAANNYLAMMAEFKPQDVFEGILVSQMSVTHMQAMDCLRIAASKKEYPKIYERFQNQGIKLMRLYNQQLETLDKHRRKGNQKMTVEHVHVHKGGQAIVGNVTQGGEGANDEK